MDFNFGKLVKDAGSAISRVVQFTEEKLGTADKTEYDSYYENLAERMEITKSSSEKLIRDIESILVPNPALRVEDYIFDKIDKKNPNRLSNLEYLGLDMIDCGNKIGPGTDYGSTLIRIGHFEQKLGSAERNFIVKVSEKYNEPMQRYLNDEMRNIVREKSVLDSKRLDLDVCKNRVRKARSQMGLHNTPDGQSPEAVLDEAERDMRIAQSEFDRQAEATKLLMEGIRHSYANHLTYLRAFVDEQCNYYKQCHDIMSELKSKLDMDVDDRRMSTSGRQSSNDEFSTVAIN